MSTNQKNVYEEIEDQENCQQSEQSYHNYSSTPTTQTNVLSNQHHFQEYQKVNNKNQHNSNDKNTQGDINDKQQSQGSQGQRKKQHPQSPKQKYIDHLELGKFSNFEDEKLDGDNISISITKTQKKGAMISYYYVYHIEGFDNKGNFSVPRRFNEFYEMRVAMIARWPGCFVPSIPAKNMLNKNDKDIIKRRVRYLNDFVKKVAKLPHLYYSQQFQTLLRAQQPDISQIFSKWPAPKSDDIINKYRINFSELSGKELNFDTNEKINDFSKFIKKNQSQLAKDRETMKKLAESNDKLNQSYKTFFSSVYTTYQKNCLSEYCDHKESDLLYLNETQVKLQQHSAIVNEMFKVNPYWILYDMIRNEERDGLAFLQALEAKTKYENKKYALQIKISDNEKCVSELSMGKKPFSSMTSKGTAEQIKYRLEVEIQQLKREKQNILIIIDIISALIAYIEIEIYKRQKKQFYLRALQKIGANQITEVQNLGEVWTGLMQSTTIKLNASVHGKAIQSTQ